MIRAHTHTHDARKSSTPPHISVTQCQRGLCSGVRPVPGTDPIAPAHELLAHTQSNARWLSGWPWLALLGLMVL